MSKSVIGFCFVLFWGLFLSWHNLSLASELSDEEALEVIFGTYDKQKNAAIWESSDKEFLDFLKSHEELYELKDKSLASQIIGKKPFIKDGIENVLLIIQTFPKQWHFGTEEQQDYVRAFPFNKMCTPVIGGAILSKMPNGLKVETAEKYIFESGEACSAALPRFQELGKGNVGVIFEETSHLSFQDTARAIHIVGIIDNEFHELLSLTTGEEYDGDVTGTVPYKYKSDLEYVDKGRPFYEIVIHTYGTNKDGKEFDKTTQYRMTDIKYVEYKKE